MNVGFECPVCGKYYFQDFDELEECSVCSWINNIVQYDNNDAPEGTNILSVNEYKIEYAALSNEKTKEATKKLKEEFRKERNGLHEEYRKIKFDYMEEAGVPSCEEMHQLMVSSRIAYMEKLNEIIKKAENITISK